MKLKPCANCGHGKAVHEPSKGYKCYICGCENYKETKPESQSQSQSQSLKKNANLDS